MYDFNSIIIRHKDNATSAVSHPNLVADEVNGCPDIRSDITQFIPLVFLSTGNTCGYLAQTGQRSDSTFTH